jgi:hypothetical protein
MLEQHIERGLWYRIHYHYIGEGLSSSEANFRAVLDIAKEHESALWIAGMADIHKYLMERSGSALSLVTSDPGHLSFKLSCATDPDLYDQPLTIEVEIPKSWPPDQITVTAHREVVVKGDCESVRIYHKDQLIAEHRRIWEKEQVRFDPGDYASLLSEPGKEVVA